MKINNWHKDPVLALNFAIKTAEFIATTCLDLEHQYEDKRANLSEAGLKAYEIAANLKAHLRDIESGIE